MGKMSINYEENVINYLNPNYVSTKANVIASCQTPAIRRPHGFSLSLPFLAAPATS